MIGSRRTSSFMRGIPLLLLLLTLPSLAAVIEVKSGDRIQAAVNKAVAGDVIRVFPGIYHETVYIDKNDITLQGFIEKGEWPTLDGRLDDSGDKSKRLNDAILYSGNGITVENLKIMYFKGNGVMGQAGNNFVIRNNWIIDTGVYGIFPQLGKNGLVERNVLSGIEDAAIYVGMSDNVDIRYNEVFDSVAGIEIENTRHMLVENNYVHNNTGGILAFITPGLPIKTNYDAIIRNNFIVNNNTENFAIPGSIVSFVPQGTGMIVMAADDVIIEGNIITGNNAAGIAIASLDFISSGVKTDPDSEPHTDNLQILDNLMWDNGQAPSNEVKALMMAKTFSTTGPDIMNLGQGKNGCILSKNQYRTVGLDDFKVCEITTTKDIVTKMTAEPVPNREIAADEKGKAVYFGVCAGCHAYSVRMIGPPTITLQALYQDNPQGIVDYIANPTKKRKDYPSMPPQDYLDEEVRKAVAEYLLTVEK